MSDWWNSLSDAFSGGFAPVAAPRDPEKDYLGSTPGGGLGNALYSNRNALVGLGLGLMGGQPGNRFGQALQGYQEGAANDIRAQNVGMTGDIKEYQFAKAQGFKGSFSDWQKTQANIKAQYGLQPQWVQKQDGTWGMIQLNSQGQPREVTPPGGGQWSPTGQWKNTGTEYTNVPNRYTPYGVPGATQPFIQPGAPGQPTTSATDAEGRPVVPEGSAPLATPPATASPATAGGIPINNAARAADIARGKGQGTLQAGLPETVAKADLALATVDKALVHPGLGKATGLQGLIDPRGYIPGTESKNFQILNKQMTGQVFREAYETLKGGGHITEIEGIKASEAIARLDLQQSTPEYKKALEELKQIIKLGRQRAISKAKGDFSPQTTPKDYETGAGSDKENTWKFLPGGVKIRERL